MPTVQRWWTLEFGSGADPAELRERLRDAVVRWTLADVPVAVSLSGGLDSSAVTALLAESGANVRTYSLGFAGEDDELPLARALADRWGTDHHEAVVDADELLDDLLQMVWSLDEPYGGGLPSWYVYRFMAEDVKVGLTGTGGDELFGNYRRFVPFERARLRALRRGDVRRYHFEPSYYFTDEAKRALGVDGPDTSALLQRVYDESGSSHPRDSVLYLDVATQLPDEFLHVTDRFSMAWSLEARTPFLDHELVEYVASLPPELRTDADDPKRLLRAAVADLVTPGPPRGAEAGLRLSARALAARRAAPARRAARLAGAPAQAGHLPRGRELPLARRRAALAGADVPALASALRRGGADRRADVQLARADGRRPVTTIPFPP